MSTDTGRWKCGDTLTDLNDLCPLVVVRVDDMLHLSLELVIEFELVVDHHVLEVLNAAFEFVEPRRGALEPIGGGDVVDEESVEVLEDCLPCLSVFDLFISDCH